MLMYTGQKFCCSEQTGLYIEAHGMYDPVLQRLQVYRDTSMNDTTQHPLVHHWSETYYESIVDEPQLVTKVPW
jgi:hypothetical protein